jgi:phosphate uptake regulator
MIATRITPITMMRADSPVEHLNITNHSSPTSTTIPQSDIERDNRSLQQQHDMASQLLDMLGDVLDGADETIENLEKDPQLLPHAILRRCSEFADLIGGLASELEQQSPQEQQRLASAIHEDINSLRLQVETANAATAAASAGGECDMLLVSPTAADYSLDSLSKTPSPSIFTKLSLETVSPTSLSAAPPPPPLEIPNDYAEDDEAVPSTQELFFRDDVNENDILKALAGASTLLRDVESAFRDIGKDDAEEIADVALTLARLFLMSLQNVYDTLTPESVVQSTSSAGGMSMDRFSPRSTVVIEELADSVDIDEEDEEDSLLDTEARTNTKSTTSSTPLQRRSSRRKPSQRVRVLWPPIGPSVDAAVGWTKEEATKRPLLAVALGLTLWPVAISTAILGGTARMADGVLQDAYKHFQEGPLITNLERGAASMYQAGKLTFITGKLAGKQTLRVVQKQIDRQGGVGPILENVGHMAVERLTHPVETAGMIFNGINWGMARVKDTVDQIVAIHQEGSAAQDLH